MPIITELIAPTPTPTLRSFPSPHSDAAALGRAVKALASPTHTLPALVNAVLERACTDMHTWVETTGNAPQSADFAGAAALAVACREAPAAHAIDYAPNGAGTLPSVHISGASLLGLHRVNTSFPVTLRFAHFRSGVFFDDASSGNVLTTKTAIVPPELDATGVLAVSIVGQATPNRLLATPVQFALLNTSALQADAANTTECAWYLPGGTPSGRFWVREGCWRASVRGVLTCNCNRLSELALRPAALVAETATSGATEDKGDSKGWIVLMLLAIALSFWAIGCIVFACAQVRMV